MVLRLFLLINGLIGFVFGVAYLFDPAGLDNTPLVVAEATEGMVGLRYLFSSLVHIALGTILLYAFFDSRYVRLALICVIVGTGGMGVVRLCAMILASAYSELNMGLIAFELFVGVLAIALLPKPMQLHPSSGA